MRQSILRLIYISCGLVLGSFLASVAHGAERECYGAVSYEFWKLQVSQEKGTMELATPAPERIKFRIVKSERRAGGTGDIFEVYRGKSLEDREPLSVVVKYNPSCRDGISETRYSYEVILLDADSTRIGCCDAVRSND